MRREEINITEETQGTRLDLVLSAGLEDYSRSFIQKLFEKGGVSVNGKPCTSKKYKCAAGDLVEIVIPEPERLEAAAEDIPLYVSLEEKMACGIGACLACVCRTAETDSHSNVKNKRICKDGPVFPAAEVEL